MLAVVTASVTAGVARADYPILDKIAQKVINKYQTATCDQLWQEKAEGKKPPSGIEARVIDKLKEDAGMRAAFFNQVSAPIVTKMFECGMIP